MIFLYLNHSFIRQVTQVQQEVSLDRDKLFHREQTKLTAKLCSTQAKRQGVLTLLAFKEIHIFFPNFYQSVFVAKTKDMQD